MNRRVGFIAAVLLLALLGGAGCESATKPAPGTGALRVKVIAEPKTGYRDPQEASTYDYGGPSRPTETGAFERVDYASLGDIIVWLEPEGAAGPPGTDARPLTIEFDEAKAGGDAVRAAAVGQRIVFQNRGAAPANVYSGSDGNEFDLGTMPPGGRGEYGVKSAGLIEVLSDRAREPVALVYAAPTRWVALARSGGTVDFTDVPPGHYKLRSWHPRLPGHESAIDLAPDRTARATIKVSVNGLPTVAGAGAGAARPR
jgi:hypothetical protein